MRDREGLYKRDHLPPQEYFQLKSTSLDTLSGVMESMDAEGDPTYELPPMRSSPLALSARNRWKVPGDGGVSVNEPTEVEGIDDKKVRATCGEDGGKASAATDRGKAEGDATPVEIAAVRFGVAGDDEGVDVVAVAVGAGLHVW